MAYEMRISEWRSVVCSSDLDTVAWCEAHVLQAQRAAADGVCFVFSFLAANTKGKHVDHPHGCSKLTVVNVLRGQFALVVSADAVDATLEANCLCVLLSVRLALERRGGSQLHVFVVVEDVLLPSCKPSDGGVVANALP